MTRTTEGNRDNPLVFSPRQYGVLSQPRTSVSVCGIDE
jgi:hypothetical protein